jgi:hypothetical protein
VEPPLTRSSVAGLKFVHGDSDSPVVIETTIHLL